MTQKLEFVNGYFDETGTNNFIKSLFDGIFTEFKQMFQGPVIDVDTMPDPPQPPRTRKCAVPNRKDIKPISQNEIREKVLKIAAEYIADPNPDYTLLFALPPGTGKTTIAVEILYQLTTQGKRVEYLGPRVDFFNDLLGAYKFNNNPTHNLYDWHSRNRTDDFGRPMCIHNKHMEEVIKRGHSAINYCINKCGSDYMKNKCLYLKQQYRNELGIYGTHPHLVRPMPIEGGFDFVIGDELPLPVFINDRYIPLAGIVGDEIESQKYTYPELYKLLVDIRELRTQLVDNAHAPKNGRFSANGLLDVLGGAQRVLADCSCDNTKAFITMIVNRRREHDWTAGKRYIERPEDKFTDYDFLPEMVLTLAREATYSMQVSDNYVGRLVFGKKRGAEGMFLNLKLRNHINDPMYSTKRSVPNHVIWFDGTADKDLYELMMERKVEKVTLDIPMKGRIIQVGGSSYNKYAMMDKDAIVNENAVAKAVEVVDAIVDNQERDGKKLEKGLVSYKAILPYFPGFKTANFGGNRGSNDMANVDLGIVIGTFQPDVEDILNTNICLQYKEMLPFDTEWIVKDNYRQYETWIKDADSDEIHGLEREIGEFKDKRLNPSLRQFREAEMIQSIFRYRPLYRDVLIIYLSSFPLTGIPVEVVTRLEAIGVKNGRTEINVGKWLAARRFVRQATEPVTAKILTDAIGLTVQRTKNYIDGLADTGEFAAIQVATKTKSATALIRNDLAETFNTNNRHESDEFERSCNNNISIGDTFKSHEKMSVIPADVTESELYFYAMNAEYVTSKLLQEHFSVGDRQAQRYMTELVDSGLFDEVTIKGKRKPFKGLKVKPVSEL